MRVIASIPNPDCKISVFAWNDNYMIEIEWGQFKQTFKISQESVNGLAQLNEMFNAEFIHSTMNRFVEMRKDFALAYEKSTN